MAKDTQEFHKQYTELYGRCQAYKEIYNMIENAESMALNVSKQIKNPDKNYEI